MKTQLTDLLTTVNQIVESFSEIEDELPPNVYNIFAKPLGKMVENMGNVVAESENFNAIMRIIALVQKEPRVKIDVTRLERWEALVGTDSTAVGEVRYEPLNTPTATDVLARTREAVPAPPSRVTVNPADTWATTFVPATTRGTGGQRMDAAVMPGFFTANMTEAVRADRPSRAFTVAELAARRAEFEAAEMFTDMENMRGRIQAAVNPTDPSDF